MSKNGKNGQMNKIVDKLEGRDQIREKVRIRDGYKCFLCGKAQEIGKRRLDVHHLDAEFDGINGRPYKNNPINRMITLCHKCHMSKVNHKVYYSHLKKDYGQI